MKKRIFLGISLVTLSTAVLAQIGRARDKGKGGERPKPEPNLLEATLFEFHEDLKLRQDQEAAWQKYADSVRAIASDRARQQRAGPAAEPRALLQRLDSVVDAARNRFAALEDAADRARALYQGLAPEQQKMADPRLVNLVLDAAGLYSAQMRRAS